MRNLSTGLALTAVLALFLCAADVCSGFESRAFQIREDFGSDPLADCTLQYYYFIPCPTSSWFIGFQNWEQGQVIGAWFRVGDISMWTGHCSPLADNISRIRVLDFAGYGTTYPGLFTVEFNIWCSDEQGCPVGSSLWSSGPVDFCYAGWNYINFNPALSVAACNTVSDPPSYPRFLVTATHIGTEPKYPSWGCDCVSTPVARGCQMHDVGCLPAPYPRPAVSYYATMHSGDYGVGFAQCPPGWFADPGDTTGNTYGYLELAWRVYLNGGPNTYDISGQVRDVIGRPVAGVTMMLAGGDGGSTTTDSAGYYLFWGIAGGISYTVTPGKEGCTFTPASRAYPSLGADQANQDYTIDCTTGYEIAGYVRDLDGVAMAGVVLEVVGGPGGSATTDSKGLYVFSDLPGGLNYTVTPDQADCYFSPESRSYATLGSDYLNQNYKTYCGTAGAPRPSPSTWGQVKALFK